MERYLYLFLKDWHRWALEVNSHEDFRKACDNPHDFIPHVGLCGNFKFWIDCGGLTRDIYILPHYYMYDVFSEAGYFDTLYPFGTEEMEQFSEKLGKRNFCANKKRLVWVEGKLDSLKSAHEGGINGI